MRLMLLVLLSSALAAPAIAQVTDTTDTVPVVPSRITGTYSLAFKHDRFAGCTLEIEELRGGRARFQLDCNRGAPDYNMGQASGFIPLVGDTATYMASNDGGTCVIRFIFMRYVARGTQDESKAGCGFGYGVFADGIYKVRNHRKPLWDLLLPRE